MAIQGAIRTEIKAIRARSDAPVFGAAIRRCLLKYVAWAS